MQRSESLSRITALFSALTLAAALAGCGETAPPAEQPAVQEETFVQTTAAETVTSTSAATSPATTTTVSTAETETTTSKETTAAESSAPEKETTAADDSAGGYKEFLNDLNVTSTQFSRAEISCGKDTVTIRFNEPSGELELYIMKRGEADFSKIPLEKDASGALTAELPFVGDNLAEMRVTGELDGETIRNEYFLDRSENTDIGYIFQSLDCRTEAYMNTDKENSFAILTDNTEYEKDGVPALSQATYITAEDVSAFTGVEIYSAISYEAPVERSTISWYKYSGGEWTALKSDLTDEHDYLGVRADLDGEGLYAVFGEPK